jgi:hypothetical protein
VRTGILPVPVFAVPGMCRDAIGIGLNTEKKFFFRHRTSFIFPVVIFVAVFALARSAQ